MGSTTLVVVIAGSIVVALGIIGFALWDLSRNQVRSGPKWVWALIICMSVPLGSIIYWVAGRVPPGEVPPPPPPVPPGPWSSPPPAHGSDADRVPSIPSSPATDRRRPGGPPVIATRSLTKRYGDTLALDSVELTVPRGATYGLIGPNGAGKTTMLSVIAGLRHPTSGELALEVPRRAMGLLVDTPLFEPWLTAFEVIDLARNLVAPDLPAARVAQVLDEVGLGDVAHRRTGGFSRGMLQRLGIASCLVGDPEVLVLDEPSSALDPAGRREVLDLVGRLAHTKTVILSTHILADVQQVCDTVGVIDRGRLLFEGPMEDLLAHTSSSFLIHVRPPAEGLAAALRSQPWTSDVVEQAPGRFRIVVSDAPRAEAELPGLLAAERASLVSFNPATDLETAFLELTR
jgi:ABC-2 type transport system ATP-binding protein